MDFFGVCDHLLLLVHLPHHLGGPYQVLSDLHLQHSLGAEFFSNLFPSLPMLM